MRKATIELDWEKSIYTGSLYFDQGTYYAFYATRIADWSERLCVATSDDGMHFAKARTNPFMGPPQGYRANRFYLFCHNGEVTFESIQIEAI